MEQPTIKNIFRDDAQNITIAFMAYRAMTREEIIVGVRLLYSQKMKPKKTQQMIVFTSHGANGS